MPGVWGKLTLLSGENEAGLFSRVMELLCKIAQLQPLGDDVQLSHSSAQLQLWQSACITPHNSATTTIATKLITKLVFIICIIP